MHGRGPTRLISPLSTFKSCGSSSIDERRRNPPDTRHAGIDFDLEQALVGILVEMLERLPFFVRADPHRPEFHDVEELSTNAGSSLA